MNLIVIGAGKVGYYLTKTLLEHGHHPTIIESDHARCSHAANDLDIPVICGMALPCMPCVRRAQIHATP